MTIQEAYKKFQLEINKNGTRGSIAIEPGEFVLRYNQVKDPWVLDTLEKKGSTDRVEDLQQLVMSDVELEIAERSQDYSLFKLPKDFLKYQTSYSVASNGRCKGVVLYNNDLHPKQKDVYNLFNEHSTPSLEYGETNILITQNRIKVFKKDFEIDKQLLSYYKKVKEIAFSGIELPDGTITDKEIHPDDLDNHIVDRIITKAATEVVRDFENQLAFQLKKEKSSTE